MGASEPKHFFEPNESQCEMIKVAQRFVASPGVRGLHTARSRGQPRAPSRAPAQSRVPPIQPQAPTPIPAQSCVPPMPPVPPSTPSTPQRAPSSRDAAAPIRLVIRSRPACHSSSRGPPARSRMPPIQPLFLSRREPQTLLFGES